MRSSLFNCDYDEKDSVRIVNAKQAAFYWRKKGIQPLSIYPSDDYKSGEPNIVFVFKYSQTQDAYKEWMDRRWSS